MERNSKLENSQILVAEYESMIDSGTELDNDSAKVFLNRILKNG
jgi:hypothetical protein